MSVGLGATHDFPSVEITHRSVGQVILPLVLVTAPVVLALFLVTTPVVLPLVLVTTPVELPVLLVLVAAPGWVDTCSTMYVLQAGSCVVAAGTTRQRNDAAKKRVWNIRLPCLVELK